VDSAPRLATPPIYSRSAVVSCPTLSSGFAFTSREFSSGGKDALRHLDSPHRYPALCLQIKLNLVHVRDSPVQIAQSAFRFARHGREVSFDGSSIALHFLERGVARLEDLLHLTLSRQQRTVADLKFAHAGHEDAHAFRVRSQDWLSRLRSR